MPMPTLVLIKTRLAAGVWEGVLTQAAGAAYQPELRVTHLNVEIPGIELRVTPDPTQWSVRFPIPPGLIADGVQTFVISDAATGGILDSFAILAGEVLAGDIRAEVDLLRAELDMLKRAFRRSQTAAAG